MIYRFNKPVILTAFGLITQRNAPYFVPINSTTVLNATSDLFPAPETQSGVIGVTNDQQYYAYQQWLQGKQSLASPKAYS